ncbi:MAG: hypothetical protein ACREMY_22405 [bacterium]
MDVATQLRYHAGLEPDLKLDVQSLADAVWKRSSIRAAVDDVIRLLQLLNYEVNGLVPSAGIEDSGQFPRKLIYAVTEIIRLLRQLETRSESEASRSARNVEFAWAAVLAGDIDNIRQAIDEDEETLS